ncbi:TRAP transporter substrate-binding protein [Arenibaculum pallidiluteum]|uniref:TRAP transporter substrate-binding protein n=1 Tax=Arenibaculum pallidiluteum TaxID=2812559 RepID=UPI001A9578F5|nr:TRAP transporter substrate-binding protein [Arenibaculum pallidiluteum]
MKVSRRSFLSIAAGAVAAPAVLREGYAQAAQVTLKLHHFLPPAANVPTNFLAPWARKVEEDSAGRLRIQLFPSMQLGGAPPQLYDQARDGVVDLVWTVLGYTSGRFPRSEAIESPFVSHRSSRVNSLAFQEYAEKHIADEFREVRPICLFTHDRGVFHTDRKVERMEDLKGLKIRFPTRVAGEALKALGATAVGMPVPQVPESISQRVINGAVVPWEVVPSVKLDELVKFHTELPGQRSFYNTAFILAMNNAKFDSLPADLKDVVVRNSGQAAARMASVAFDNSTPKVIEQVNRKSGTIVTLSEAETARWEAATRPVVEDWARQMKERNVDGPKLLETVRELIAKYEKA